MNVGTLTSFLKLDRSEYTSGMNQAQQQAKQMDGELRKMEGASKRAESSMNGLGGAAKTVGAALAAMKLMEFTNSAIDQFTKFQSATVDMGKVTSRSFAEISTEIEAMPKELGSATQLMTGYYEAMSAGVTKPAEAMALLTTAAKASNAAHVEQAEVITATTKLMSGFEGQIRSATEATDLMFKIEEVGQTKFRELVPVIGEAAKISKDLSVSQYELGAALAQMSQYAGSTAQAATQYKAVLFGLYKPQKAMEELFERTGYASGQAMVKQLGLSGAIKLVKSEAEKSGVTLGKFFESTEALLGISELGAKGWEEYEAKLKSMAEASGATEKAFAEWRTTFAATKQTFNNTIGLMAIEMGEKIAPTLQKAMEGIAGNIDKITSAMTGLLKVVAVGSALYSLPTVFNIVSKAILAARLEMEMFLLVARTGGIAAALTTPLFGVSIAATAAAGAMGKLKIAGGVLFAAFAGWELGKWLSDNFEEARLAGIMFVDVTGRGVIELESAAKSAWAGIGNAWDTIIGTMKDAFAGFLLLVGEGLNKIPGADGAANAVTEYANSIEGAASVSEEYKKKLIEIATELENNRAAHREAIDGMVSDAMRLEKTASATNLVGGDDGTEAARAKIAALNMVTNAEKIATQDVLDIRENFADEYNKIILSTEQFEIRSIEKRIAEFKKAGVNEVQLEEWKQKELQSIELRAMGERLRLVEELASGNQYYANQAIEIMSTILDAEEKKWAIILGNDDDAHALRLKKEQEYSASVTKQWESDTEIITTALAEQTEAVNTEVEATVNAAEVHAKSITDMLRSYRQLNAGMTEHQIEIDNLSAAIEEAIVTGQEMGMTEIELTEIRQAGIQMTRLAIEEQQKAAYDLSESFLQAAAGMTDFQVQQNNLKKAVLDAAYAADNAGATWGTLNRIIEGGNILLAEAAAAHAQLISDTLAPYRQINAGMSDLEITLDNLERSTQAAIRAGKELGMTEAELAEIRMAGDISAQNAIDEAAADAAEEAARATREATQAADDLADALLKQAEAAEAAREAAYEMYKSSRQIMTQVRQLGMTDYARTRQNLTFEYIEMGNQPGISNDEQMEIFRALTKELAKLAAEHAEAVSDMLTPYRQINAGMTDFQIKLAGIVEATEDAVRAGRELGLSESELNEIRAAGVILTKQAKEEEAAAAAAKAEDDRNALLDKLQSAYDREAAIFQSTIDQFDSFSASLKSFRNSLKTGDLSTLSPEQKYLEAQANFTDVSRRAQLGDVDAIAALESTASAFLEASRGYNASGEAYIADFAAVTAALDATIGLSDRQSDIAQQQLDKLTAQVDGLLKINAAVETVADILRAIRAGGSVPKFADGGYHSGGLRLVGENGPELEYTGPSNIINANDTRSILSGGNNAELIAEIKELRRDLLVELRADKTQRGAVGQATISRLEQVADKLDSQRRVLDRKVA